MDEATTTQPMGLGDEQAAEGTADNGQGGAALAAAPAWEGAQCVQDARDCIAVAQDAIKRNNLAAGLSAVALAVASLADAVEVMA